jgi:hypothetical protein
MGAPFEYHHKRKTWCCICDACRIFLNKSHSGLNNSAFDDIPRDLF